MKKRYETPAMQENFTNVDSDILVISNIGEGGEGNEGDVKESRWEMWDEEE